MNLADHPDPTEGIRGSIDSTPPLWDTAYRARGRMSTIIPRLKHFSLRFWGVQPNARGHVSDGGLTAPVDEGREAWDGRRGATNGWSGNSAGRGALLIASQEVTTGSGRSRRQEANAETRCRRGRSAGSRPPARDVAAGPTAGSDRSRHKAFGCRVADVHDAVFEYA